MGSPNAQAKMDQPCWQKKKTAESGFFSDLKDHFDEFRNTSMDQHKICLKRSYRGVRDYVKIKKEALKVNSSTKAANETVSSTKGAETTPQQ